MWPYGTTQPKAALAIAGTPLVRHHLELFRNLKLSSTTIVTGHLDGEVRSAVGAAPGVSFRAQGGEAGTAAALLSARVTVEETLVFFGDVLVFEDDLRELLAVFRSGTAVAAMLTAPCDDPGTAVVVNTRAAEDGPPVLTGLVACGRDAGDCFAGVLAFRKPFLRYVERTGDFPTCLAVGAMPPRSRELAESLHQAVKAGERIRCVSARCPVVDLDKPWHLLEANEQLIRYRSERLTASDIHPTATVSPEARLEGYVVVGPHATIGPGVSAAGNLWVGAGARVLDGAILEPDVVVGDEAKVWRHCLIERFSTLGPRTHVGHCAEFSGMLMEGAYSYHYGEFWGVAGRFTDLGAATVCGTLRFDDRDTSHLVGKHRETPRRGANAVYLGDFVRTGVNATLMPGVKVGSWSVVGPGVVLGEDLPERTCVTVKQDLERRPWGPERYGW